VLTNYFELLSKPSWTLHQYHIDFDPPTESKRLRIGLFSEHSALFPCKAFDGTTLFSLNKLDQPVTVLESTRNHDQTKVQLTIKLVNEVAANTPEAIRLLNIVFRRCLGHCKLKEFGKERAYYDFEHMNELPRYHLKIAPGYKTTMNIYNSKIFLCAEVAHKLFNINSVLESMQDIYRNSSRDNYRAAVTAHLIGQTVMTMYNKRTYKVDDIAWEEKASDTFETRPKRGETEPRRVSFIDYYYEHYKIKIKDEGQPLLVSNPKAKDKRAGQDGPIKLVPELCALTGTILLKDFAKDFNMKKDLDAITKLSPEVR
jgi:aubergine-like protein